MSDRGEGGPAVLDPQAGFFESRHSVTISVRSPTVGDYWLPWVVKVCGAVRPVRVPENFEALIGVNRC